MAVSGFIKTIDGDYEVYVIGIKNVLRKISLQYELPNAIIKRKRRIRNRNIWILFLIHERDFLKFKFKKYLVSLHNYLLIMYI